MTNEILALDLATTSGWCEGEPGGVPRFGSVRFAAPGSNSPAVFGGALQFLGTRLQAWRPRMIVYEAPLDPRHMRGRTNKNTARILLGLPAVIEAVAYRCGVYDIHEVRATEVRKFFLAGVSWRGDPKRAVMAQCRALGHAPPDDNAADAIALWFYACALKAPNTATLTTPLFASERP